MRYVLFLTVFSNSIFAQKTSDMRVLFAASYRDRKSAAAFRETMLRGASGTPLAIGYRGVAEMMFCRYITNPVSKFNHFCLGKNLLEKAIGQEPNNPELHFLRYTIQSNVPCFLNYGSDLTADKKIIVTYLAVSKQTADTPLQKMISDYIFAKN
jgi:hypothetical protein